MISFHLVDQRENKWNEFNWYYNSKYIDAEETDVSRNQTSTWLIDDWRLLMKQRYSGCPFNKEKFISQFSLRMGIVIEFPLLTGLAAEDSSIQFINLSSFQSILFFEFDWRIKWRKDWWMKRKKEELMKLNWRRIVGCLLFLNLWVMGGAPANAPQRRENKKSNQPTKQNWITLFPFLLELLARLWAGGPANAPQEERERKEKERRQTKGMEWNSWMKASNKSNEWSEFDLLVRQWKELNGMVHQAVPLRGKPTPAQTNQPN